jgi:hypothetical protein
MTLTESGIRTPERMPIVNTPSDRYHLADKMVWRVGYGAMRLAGPGVLGPPHLAENLAAGSLSVHNDEIGCLTSAFGTP